MSGRRIAVGAAALASEEGQQRAAPEVAGSAPISEEFRARVSDVVEWISGPGAG